MNAKIINAPQIVCPYCGEGKAGIGHLVKGQSFGPWYCDECGKSYSGLRTESGADIELLPRWKREVPILLEYIGDPKLKLVVPGIELSEDDGRKSEYYPEGHGYFYDESTCPSNLLRSGDHIDAKVVHDGDEDPHGVFRFVRVITEETI